MDIYELEVVEERSSQRRRITAEGEEPDDAIEWARKRGFTVYAFRLLGDARWSRLERAARAYGNYDADGYFLGSKDPPKRGKRSKGAENTVAMWSFGLGFLACCFLCGAPGIAFTLGLISMCLALGGFVKAAGLQGAGVTYAFGGLVVGVVAMVGGFPAIGGSATPSSTPSTQSSRSSQTQPPPPPNRAPSSARDTRHRASAPARQSSPTTRTLRGADLDTSTASLSTAASADATPVPPAAQPIEPPTQATRPSGAELGVGDAAEFGDARISVASAAIGRVRVQDPASTEPIELPFERLLVVVEISHAGRHGKIDYTSLRDAEGVLLVDDLGRSIRLRPPGLGVPVIGAVGYAPLRSGERTTDLLIFARPEPDASKLYLTLPGTPVGQPGEARFAFDAPKSIVND